MARPKSLKNMTPGERRSAKADVGKALKALLGDLKAVSKAKATAEKEAEKAIKAATKARDTAVAAAEKRLAAGEKGKAKLEAQLASYDAE